ncbi:hypothetical protein EVAR_65409_1 [Eumeta japonica]|uniref:Uncharacterized protein n=1 Tax=Eumeta variegata TaxID=151549 RepID=A0A4C1ZQX1_EUMVA|nr:hypothetical protein EVAR_65409_1 [Eumeta japonica]
MGRLRRAIKVEPNMSAAGITPIKVAHNYGINSIKRAQSLSGRSAAGGVFIKLPPPAGRPPARASRLAAVKLRLKLTLIMFYFDAAGGGPSGRLINYAACFHSGVGVAALSDTPAVCTSSASATPAHRSIELPLNIRGSARVTQSGDGRRPRRRYRAPAAPATPRPVENT